MLGSKLHRMANMFTTCFVGLKMEVPFGWQVSTNLQIAIWPMI